MVTGGCLCGSIRFEIDARPVGGGFCYCRDCQYTSGGLAGAVLVFPRAAHRLRRGTPNTYWSVSEEGTRVGRSFCPACGTHLSAINPRHPEIIPIRVGVLDDPGVFRPGANLWLRSAQPWHQIDRVLACFETQPAN